MTSMPSYAMRENVKPPVVARLWRFHLRKSVNPLKQQDSNKLGNFGVVLLLQSACGLMIDRDDEPRDVESRGSFIDKNRACSVGEFFKGWRRKAGLVTLAMACVLMVGWMRSYLIIDAVSLGAVKQGQSLMSKGGRLGLTDQWFYDKDQLYWKSFTIAQARIMFPIHGGPDIRFWVVPYWSLVLPLTLLSAWLILAKPRKAKAATGNPP